MTFTLSPGEWSYCAYLLLFPVLLAWLLEGWVRVSVVGVSGILMSILAGGGVFRRLECIPDFRELLGQFEFRGVLCLLYATSIDFWQ